MSIGGLPAQYYEQGAAATAGACQSTWYVQPVLLGDGLTVYRAASICLDSNAVLDNIE